MIRISGEAHYDTKTVQITNVAVSLGNRHQLDVVIRLYYNYS